MTFKKWRDSMEWALMVALVLGGGAIAQAQNDQAAQDKPGKIVRIGPAGDSGVTIDGEVANGQIQLDDQQPNGPQQPEPPKHWIGILGGPVTDELRAQIDIPDGQGVLVRQVVPDSPADKAGVKAFDILLKANDANLADVRDLTALVKREGESGGKIALDVLRRGQHQSLSLTPETRPEQLAGGAAGVLSGQDAHGFGFGGMGPGGAQMQFRMFGPGTVLSHQGLGLSQMPNGVSVSIQKQNDEPAHITVKRGNDSWDIVGDDPSSLSQLPDDVRPFVEQLLAGGGRMQFPLPAMPTMPGMPGPAGMPGIPPGALNDGALQERLQKMEQHMQQMQQQMEQQFGQPSNENQDDQPEADSE